MYYHIMLWYMALSSMYGNGDYYDTYSLGLLYSFGQNKN